MTDRTLDEFRAELSNAGLAPYRDHAIITDYKWHPLGTTADNKKRVGSYRVRVSGSGRVVGYFHDYRAGEQAVRFPPYKNGQASESPQEAAERIARDRAAAAERRKATAAVAAKAERRWAKAKPAQATHPYLVDKGIQPNGLRQEGDLLLVPARDAEGNVHTLQEITPTGEKKFLFEGALTGHFYMMDTPGKTICIGEGFATMATVCEATGLASVVAFSAGNLDPVTAAIAAEYPDALIVLCADDDHLTVKPAPNPGVTQAKRAANHVPHAAVAIPQFGPDRGEKDTDFNDMHDHDAVMDIINDAIAKAESLREASEPPPSPSPPPKLRDDLYVVEPFSEIVKWNPDDEQELIVGVLPALGLAILYGAPKSKKSFIATDMGMAVARATVEPDITWGGCDVMPGIVVAIVGEGARGSRKRRAAYHKHARVPDNIPFYAISARPNLGLEFGDRAKLIKSIEAALGERKPALIIIDTLSRMLHGEPENAEGMDHFIENAEAVCEHFECLALAVHHQPWDQKRMRGHSTAAGASVANMRAEKIDKLESKLIIEEAKDDEDGITFAVRFRQVEMGYSKTRKREATTRHCHVARDIAVPLAAR